MLRKVLSHVLWMILLVTSSYSQARELPKFENDKQRAAFLLAGASRIATIDKETYSKSKDLIAKAYAKLGDAENARQAIMSVKMADRKFTQCIVAAELAKAGQIAQAQKIMDEVGDQEVIWDLGIFGKTDKKKSALYAIKKANEKNQPKQTLAQLSTQLKASNTPEEYQTNLLPMIDELIAVDNIAVATNAIKRLTDKLACDRFRKKNVEYYAKKDQAQKALAYVANIEKKFTRVLAKSEIPEILGKDGRIKSLQKLIDDATQANDGGLANNSKLAMIKIYSRKGDVQNAIKTIKQLKPSSQTWGSQNAIDALHLDDQYIENATLLLNTFEDEKARKNTIPNFVKVYANKGDFEKAKSIIKGMKKNRSNIAHAYYDCFKFALDQGDKTQAKAFLVLVEAQLPGLTQHTDKQFMQRWLSKAYAMLSDHQNYMRTVSEIKMPEKSTFDYTVDAVVDAGVILTRNNEIMPLLQSLRFISGPYKRVKALTKIAEKLTQDKK